MLLPRVTKRHFFFQTLSLEVGHTFLSTVGSAIVYLPASGLPWETHRQIQRREGIISESLLYQVSPAPM